MEQLSGAIDVSGKAPTFRRAVAESTLAASPEVIAMVRENRLPKLDPLATARAAAMLAVKATPSLIPHCHPIAITGITVDFRFEDDGRAAADGFARVTARCEVTSLDRTGPEIETLCGASVATLTLYDVIKGVFKGARIERTFLLEKEGGRSGHWTHEAEIEKSRENV